jgi:hypothetical protein
MGSGQGMCKAVGETTKNEQYIIINFCNVQTIVYRRTTAGRNHIGQRVPEAKEGRKMDIKELVQVKAESGCVGCVAYPEMVKAIEKKGSHAGTLCDRLGHACLRGTIWVEKDENAVKHS